MKLNWNNTSIRTKLITGFAIISFLFLLILIVCHQNSKKIIKSTSWIIHTHNVITHLAELESRLIDLETGQRGFLIVGRNEYLQPYETSLKAISKSLNDLRTLTLDNPSQTIRFNSIDSLVTLKLVELNRTIQLRREDNGFELAKEIVLTNEGKILMDQIRVKITEVKNEELRLLDIRSQTPLESQEQTTNLLIVLTSLCILSIITIIITVLRSISRPIKKLTEGARIAGQGNLDYQFGIEAKDEIGQLAQSFESMLNNLKSTLASKSKLENEIETRKKVENSLISIKNDLEKSEANLIESNKAKDKFFTIIAHDLKSPFQSLIWLSNLLNEQVEELNKTDLKKYIELIHVSIKQMSDLVNGLLVWAQAQNDTIEFKPDHNNLSDLIESVIEVSKDAANSKSIKINFEMPDQIMVFIDKNMVSTVIRNLLSNAIKFTQEKGEIFILVSLDKKNSHDGFVEIMIKDNGVGISKEAQSKLFDISNTKSTLGTANEKGTGLGLNLCKEFVEKHQGKIWVESELGKGSSFYVTFPIS